ncbi:unnamed protein product [Owenia fusiformis]|uniref:SH3 domain-containing protein n=1 Tax=Owenia fusiformis TaxID=6347 RepID=A0A8S4NDR5_OWEFU|nr:unnamed protein product [Owenia fusiformis]
MKPGTRFQHFCLAKALYDNNGDSPDELDFRKGDVLTVLEQNTASLEGWWLCSLKGKQGIAPGNRLKLLAGMYDSGYQNQNQNNRNSGDFRNSAEIRKSWEMNGERVMTPQRVGNVYMYQQRGTQDYDVPPVRNTPDRAPPLTSPQNYDTPPGSRGTSVVAGDMYDTLPGKNATYKTISEYDTYDTPQHGSVPQVTNTDYDVPQPQVLSNRSSTISMLSTGSGGTLSSSASNLSIPGGSARSSSEMSNPDIYDVPRGSSNRASRDSLLEIYDTPPAARIRQGTPSSTNSRGESQDYDTPVASRSIHQDDGDQDYDTPRSSSRLAESTDSAIYDTPPSRRKMLNTSLDIYDTPPGSKSSSLIESDYDVPMSSKSTSIASSKNSSILEDEKRRSNLSSSLDSEADYDVPKSHHAVCRDTSKLSRDTSKLSRDASIMSCDDSIVSVDSQGMDDYDVPPTPKVIDPSEGALHQSRSSIEHVIEDDDYDVPTKNTPIKGALDETDGTLKRSKLQESDLDSIYDVPPQVTKDENVSKKDLNQSLDKLASISLDDHMTDIPYKALPLELNAAMDMLVKRQQNAQSSLAFLLAFKPETWENQENLAHKTYDVKIACKNIQKTLREFTEFSEGTVANSRRAADKTLPIRLQQQLLPIQDSLTIVDKLIKHADELDWQAAKLCDNKDLKELLTLCKTLPDNIHTLETSIQGNGVLLFKRAKKIEDERRSMEGRPLPPTPPSVKNGKPPPTKPKPKLNRSRTPERVSRDGRTTPNATHNSSFHASQSDLADDNKNNPNNANKNWKDSEDYVSLDTSKNNVGPHTPNRDNGREKILSEHGDRTGKVIPSTPPALINTEGDGLGLTPKFKERMDKLLKDSQKPVKTHMEVLPDSINTSTHSHNTDSQIKIDSQITRESLHDNDKQILEFYSGQMETHSSLLTNAIDAFLSCCEYNQPPKVFIAHSKFVVLAAHKLVYIGDTLHRNLLHQDCSARIMGLANKLCECLKLTVTTTKNAALNYPSIEASQQMVDSVVGVSHAAENLKMGIINL